MKNKTCKVCKEKFESRNSLQIVCCLECAIWHAQNKRDKKIAKDKTNAARETREALKKMLTASAWIKRVDDVYNPFIRARDEKAGLPCPSCLRYDHEIPDTYFGKWDCGHYLGKGAFPELRYIEINTWRQCKSCNGGSGKYAKKNHTVSQTYRITLIERIGLEQVEWLESKHEPKRYRIPELMELE